MLEPAGPPPTTSTSQCCVPSSMAVVGTVAVEIADAMAVVVTGVDVVVVIVSVAGPSRAV
jgi:hypothetical protein